jgi:hypothetical protein
MSEIKPNAILDGITREEARVKLLRWIDEADNFAFAHNGYLYGCPGDLLHNGVDESCGQVDCDVGCEVCWALAINAYYDAKEAASKPRWVEPRMEEHSIEEVWHRDGIHYDERDRTNARRRIEAFIAANQCAKSEEGFAFFLYDGKLQIRRYGQPRYADIGTVVCSTREIAEEVIRRYEPELRMLMG